ncbi:MAG: hypothetical protein LBQ58_06695 [Synergistaceae bacterium]|jgi:hypothetical protein|nr:hypothetical protein [Synergistaceae bacterium]
MLMLFIIPSIYHIWIYFHVSGDSRACYYYEADEIESIILKLEYLGILASNYTKKTGIVPSGKADLNVIFHEFRKKGATEWDFADYIYGLAEKRGDKYSNDDILAIMAAHLINYPDTKYYNYRGIIPSKMTAKDIPYVEDDFIKLYNNIDYCFFKKGHDYPSDNFLYIGIKSPKIISTKGYQEFLRVIVSMKDKRYFQDFSETPYENGQILITKITIKREENAYF